MARAAKNKSSSHRLSKSLGLIRDLLLVLSRKVDEVVVFRTDQDGNRGLVEASSLAIPLLDAVERALARQVEHEQDCDGVVADQGEHIDEFPLTTQVPYAEGDLRVADADRLLHEVNTQRLDVILVPAAFDIFHHQGSLSDLRIAHHADLDYNVIASIAIRAITVAVALSRSLVVVVSVGAIRHG